MKTKIARLDDAGVAEDDIVSALRITHLAYRRMSKKQDHGKLTAQARNEIVCGTGELYSIKDLVMLYKTTEGDIRNAKYSELTKPQALPREVTRKHAHISQALHTNSYTYEQIAEICGCSKSYVAMVAAVEGYSRQEQGVTNWNQVLADLAGGKSVTQVAKEHNISRAAIYYHKGKQDA